MNLIDEFAGIGGFSLAAYWMGWQTIAFVERDPKCQLRLRKRFDPDIPIYDDIATAPIEQYAGTVDIISAGFPCQPFSHAGKRGGTSDDRYLWDETVGTLPKGKPAWFVGENVAGIATMVFERGGLNVEGRRLTRTADSDDYFSLLSREEYLQLERCCADVESAGYEVQPFVIPACAVNAPHRRDRVWILAHAQDKRESREHENAEPRDTDQFATSHADNERRLGRGEQGKDRERAGNPGRGDDRSLGESAIDSREPFADANGNDCGRADPVTGGPRLQRHELSGTSGEGAWTPRSIAERFANEHWSQAASRLCRVDDGLPDRVDRLKQLGNSVVPIEVYEIFLAIAQADATRLSNEVLGSDRERSTERSCNFCADTGSDARPYRDAGYNVILVGKEIGVENFHPPADTYGIIANPVCTEFSIATGIPYRKSLNCMSVPVARSRLLRSCIKVP